MKRDILRGLPDSAAVWMPLGLFISGICLAIANYCGIGYTSDSHLYINIAGEIDEQGLLLAKGLNIKPPLYPLLIYWFGAEAIPVINVICFLFTFCILFSFGMALEAKILRLFYWAILIFSTPLYLIHSFAWTEPPFICVLLLTFLCFHQYQKHGKYIFFYSAILLLLLLPFIRFAGIFIVMPLFLILFIRLPLKMIRLLSIAFCLCGVIFFIWVLHFEDGFIQRWETFTAPFNKDVYSYYMHNVYSYLEAVSMWVLPLSVYKPIRIFFGFTVLIIIGIASFNFFRRKNSQIMLSAPFIFLVYYFALHFVFQVEYYSAERYLTPFYNLLVLSLFIWIDKKFPLFRRNGKQLILILLFLLLMYNILRTTKNVVFWSHVRCEESHKHGYFY